MLANCLQTPKSSGLCPALHAPSQRAKLPFPKEKTLLEQMLTLKFLINTKPLPPVPYNRTVLTLFLIIPPPAPMVTEAAPPQLVSSNTWLTLPWDIY